MNIQQFLNHHGIVRNPFAEEDAQTDPIFKEHCIVSTYHPTWDKVYGDPAEPATSIVFGEKGSGKTAMRLQIARHLAEYNRRHPRQRLFVIHYDDLNPFLDRFRQQLRGRRRRPDRMLEHWRLWDHMDAILSLAVTGLVDRILHVRHPSTNVDAEVSDADVNSLDRNQARDLLLLAACYDQSLADSRKERWGHLRRRLHVPAWHTWWQMAVGVAGTAGLLGLVVTLIVNGHGTGLLSWWLLWMLGLGAVWAPYAWKVLHRTWLAWGLQRWMRTANHTLGPLRAVLMRFTTIQLASQPLPNRDSTDARYEMLLKLQALLHSLGYHGLVVLVDRLDEPHAINGQVERMKALLWPMLDNKFLTHPGLGLKLMVPIELTRFVNHEDREFFQRARLDKQNVIASFQWSGEALYDVANARLRACAAAGAEPQMRDLFDPTISDQRLIEVMRQLRVPRYLFKFMYRLLVDHCHAHTDAAPQWTIAEKTFEATLAVFRREQDAFERGIGPG